MQRYRLYAGIDPNGYARSAEHRNTSGWVVDFAAELGAPQPEVTLVGAVRLDAGLAWRSLDVEANGRRLALDLEPAAELEVEGVPALFGVTARRLRAGGLRPSQAREVDVLRVFRDLRVEGHRARYQWIGGQSWRYTTGTDTLWLAVRPETGVVRSVEAVAELEQ